MWLTNSLPISKDNAVASVLGDKPRYVAFKASLKHLQKPDTVIIGWGNKPFTVKSRAWAKELSLPYHQLEDGFIAYTTHPSMGDCRFSIIHDKQGIYYDARHLSDLDSLLNNCSLSDQQTQRAHSLIVTLSQYGISKYNQACGIDDPQLAALEKNIVVVIDQTAGDASIAGALASEQDFVDMLESAIADNPNKTLYIKVHPDVLLGKKQGVLHPLLRQYPAVKILPQEITNHQLFSIASTLYTVSSQMGFEALWYHCPVHCFGMPFYAGRGLTIDHKKPIHPRKAITLESLTFGALIDYCHYIHPETKAPCEIEDVLPFIIQRKRVQNTFNYPTLYAVDFSFWKRLFLPSWLNPMSQKVVFCNIEKAKKLAGDADAILLWSNNHLAIEHPHVIRVEDGFIRSTGLGIDLTPPLSLIFDTQGIYFDAQRPSRLETLLQNMPVSNAQCKRAEALIDLIKQEKISKYNLAKKPIDGSLKGNKKCILVPGQVESDASIKFGVITPSSIEDVLQNARSENPDAYIIYRPHPDVLTGERQGLSPEKAAVWADYIDTDSDIHSTIEQADEVHVLTSLVGFEALLRQKKVICYGQPFYSGWGLTSDKTKNTRRTNKRSLYELCYIVLIAYPRYLHPKTGLDSTPESIIKYLASQNNNVRTGIGFLGRLTRKIQMLVTLMVNSIKSTA